MKKLFNTDGWRGRKKLPEGCSYDPELNKYRDVVLFPEKLERANQILKESPFPQDLLDMINRPAKK